MKHKPDPDKLAEVVAESAQQIWLAGLSALSMAEKESGRFFDALSRLGANIQSQTGKTADVAKKTVHGSKDMATGAWDRMEELFELRVGRALNALQIPTARDIKELSKRVDKLSKAVDKINAKHKGEASPKKKRKTGKKAAAKKKTSRKKAPAKIKKTSKPRKKRSGK